MGQAAPALPFLYVLVVEHPTTLGRHRFSFYVPWAYAWYDDEAQLLLQELLVSTAFLERLIGSSSLHSYVTSCLTLGHHGMAFPFVDLDWQPHVGRQLWRKRPSSILLGTPRLVDEVQFHHGPGKAGWGWENRRRKRQGGLLSGESRGGSGGWSFAATKSRSAPL